MFEFNFTVGSFTVAIFGRFSVNFQVYFWSILAKLTEKSTKCE